MMPGKKAGFGGAQQKAYPVKLMWSMDEAGEDGNNAPGDHDAGNPGAGAPALDQHRSRDLEEKITHKEDAGAKAIDFGRKAQSAGHLQCGVAEVDAVEVGDDVENEQIRKQAAHNTLAGAFRDGGG